MKRFDRVKQILEDAVGGTTIGAHGNFWRGLSLDAFKVKKVFGRVLLVVGNPDISNLVLALEGKAPFGADLGVPGSIFPRMPEGFPPVSTERIQVIRQWIADGCPDEEEALFDPVLHNNYWRDFDNWAMFQVAPEIQDAIGEFFNAADLWMAFARNPAGLTAWLAALSQPATAAATSLLSSKILQTIQAHYGDPINLAVLMESYELFGSDHLPDDPFRPADPRHNMNGTVMWFFFSAMADSQLRSAAGLANWAAIGKAILIGLLNDGLIRGRFPVTGFTADPAGAHLAKLHVESLADDQVAPELARRFVESNIGS